MGWITLKYKYAWYRLWTTPKEIVLFLLPQRSWTTFRLKWLAGNDPFFISFSWSVDQFFSLNRVRVPSFCRSDSGFVQIAQFEFFNGFHLAAQKSDIPTNGQADIKHVIKCQNCFCILHSEFKHEISFYLLKTIRKKVTVEVVVVVFLKSFIVLQTLKSTNFSLIWLCSCYVNSLQWHIKLLDIIQFFK